MPLPSGSIRSSTIRSAPFHSASASRTPARDGIVGPRASVGELLLVNRVPEPAQAVAVDRPQLRLHAVVVDVVATRGLLGRSIAHHRHLVADRVAALVGQAADRMDGAGFHTPEIATMKARTSAIFRSPTKALEDVAKERPGTLGFPNRLPVQGGLPILFEGQCVGGIGVSGVKSHEDEQVAQAGLNALL